MNKWSKEEIAKIMLDVKKKAITDGEFRKLCLDNSVEAIKVISGKEFPAEIKIKFIENDGVHMTIVLPNAVEEEMSEDDLDKVAGGGATCSQVSGNQLLCTFFNEC